LKIASKTFLSLSLTAILAASLTGCGPQDGLNRDFASEQDLVAALVNEGFECRIFEEHDPSIGGEAAIEQAEKHSDLYGWKSRSWCYPEPNTGEIGINIFENSSGAEKASLDFTCNGSFIQVKNWILYSDDLGVMSELANLAQTQVRTWPNCDLG
jgi:hypothetical protein